MLAALFVIACFAKISKLINNKKQEAIDKETLTYMNQWTYEYLLEYGRCANNNESIYLCQCKNCFHWRRMYLRVFLQQYNALRLCRAFSITNNPLQEASE